MILLQFFYFNCVYICKKSKIDTKDEQQTTLRPGNDDLRNGDGLFLPWVGLYPTFYSAIQLC